MPGSFWNLLDFDLSSIPSGATISAATLNLYGFTYSTGHTGYHWCLSGDNSFYLERVTSPWDEATVNWSNKPSTTTVNRVASGPYCTANTNAIVDVSNLVQDMVDDPANSHGFMLKLVTDEAYKALVFASSDHPDPALHPKLEITYTVTGPDYEPPTVNCKNITVALDETGQTHIEPSEVFLSGSDNCGDVNLESVYPNTFGCVDLGNNTVTLTVNDGNGNTNTCQATVTVVVGTPPTAPSPITSTVLSISSAYLDWADDNYADRYQVRYRIQGTGGWTSSGNIFVSHHTLTGLAANHVYQYQVRSRCTNANTSDWSAMQTFFTSTCGIPTGLAVSNIMANSAQVDWNPASSAVGYMIRYRKPGNGWTNTFSYTNSKSLNALQSNSPYEVQVSSLCLAGTGAWSPSVMFHTPSSKPLKYDWKESITTRDMFELTVFPNPLAREQTLRIQFENPAAQEGILNIFDVNGRIVHQRQFQAETGSNQLTVERLNFNSGVYFVNLRIGVEQQITRLIIRD